MCVVWCFAEGDIGGRNGRAGDFSPPIARRCRPRLFVQREMAVAPLTDIGSRARLRGLVYIMCGLLLPPLRMSSASGGSGAGYRYSAARRARRGCMVVEDATGSRHAGRRAGKMAPWRGLVQLPHLHIVMWAKRKTGQKEDGSRVNIDCSCTRGYTMCASSSGWREMERHAQEWLFDPGNRDDILDSYMRNASTQLMAALLHKSGSAG